MFVHLRLASRPIRPCSRTSSQICSRRNFSSAAVARSSLAPEPPSDEEALEEAIAEDEAFVRQEAAFRSRSEGTSMPESYNQFLEVIGDKFKIAKPRNWLGGEVPFPMNPSFKPPPPISDAVRTALYREFMQDPVANNVRVLSQRYHLSLKRVDAILRLKGMEEAWIKGKPLQTGFRDGMEKLLGVAPLSRHPADQPTRVDAHEADILEEDERRDASRQRYQRLYWEAVPEDGREPIVPGSLEHAKMVAKRFAKATEEHKSDKKLMPRIRDTETIKTPKEKVQVITKPGRPMIKFIDVGGKFIEVDDRLRRIAEAERRARAKVRRADQKRAAFAERKSRRN